MIVPLETGWRHRAVGSWPVCPALVDAGLPGSLGTDCHIGNAWLSVGPLTKVSVRPMRLSRSVGVCLPALTVRTWVTGGGPFQHRARVLPRWADGRVQVDSQRHYPGGRPGRRVATCWPADGPFASVLIWGWRFDAETLDGSVRDTDVGHDPRTLHAAGTTVETDTLPRADGVDRPTAEPVCCTPELGVEVAAGRRASGVSAGGR